MIKKIVVLSCFCSFFILQGQTDKYWIYFDDKANSTDASTFLSPRALEKRKLYNIPLDEKDLPVSIENIAQINAIKGVKIMNTSKWMNAVSVQIKDEEALLAISNLPKVKNIEKVHCLKSQVKREESEYKFGQLTETEDISETDYTPTEYGNAYNQINMIRTNFLHEKGYEGQDMLIAVFDAGFVSVDTMRVFENLRTENRLFFTQNFVNPAENVYRYSTHGTSVLSLMAGYKPGTYIGTAPKATYCLMVTESVFGEMPVEEDNWLRAAEIADSLGVDVINSSLGYSTFDSTSLNHTYADMDGNTTVISRAADIAASKGILVVTSAGNEGNSGWKYITAPADADSVLTIGAVNDKGVYASFSSVGPTSDGRVKPNVSAQGRDAYVVTTNGTVVKGSGTSFSSPITAGSAACLWQSARSKNNMGILSAIEESASQASFADIYLGYGIPDFSKAYAILHPMDSLPLPNDIAFIFPNPAINTLYMRYFSKKDQVLTFTMYNTLSQPIFTKKTSVTADFNELSFDLAPYTDMSGGLYYLMVESEKEKMVFKFVKDKGL